MRPELVSKTRLTEGGHSFDYHTGKMNGILITGATNSDNRITVKIRDDQETLILASRLSHGFCEFLTDMYYGQSNGGQINSAIKKSLKYVDDQLRLITNDNTLSAVNVFNDLTEDISTIYLPLGNIDLADKELEVLYESFETKDRDLKMYIIHLNDGPELYYNYDQTSDRNISMKGIRQVFIENKNGFVENKMPKDIQFQLDVVDGRNMLVDLEGVLASTKVFSEIESHNYPNYLRVYEETLPIPAQMRVKLSGDSASETELIFVREMIPDSVENAAANTLRELQARLKTLESQNPNVAENYVKAGITVNSEEVEAAADELETT